MARLSLVLRHHREAFRVPGHIPVWLPGPMQRVTPGAEPSVHTCGPSFSPLTSGGQDCSSLSWEALLAQGPPPMPAPHPTCTSPPGHGSWTRRVWAAAVAGQCGSRVPAVDTGLAALLSTASRAQEAPAGPHAQLRAPPDSVGQRPSLAPGGWMV